VIALATCALKIAPDGQLVRHAWPDARLVGLADVPARIEALERQLVERLERVEARLPRDLVPAPEYGRRNLGGEVGAEPAIKGLTFNGDLGTFLAALAAYLPIIQPIADPSGTATTTMISAISALEAALPEALAANARVK
jgi:hypothetical protein